ncbi:MAG: cyclic nucleotide-binding domain-containing protein [Acidiferrobacterales bacterium]
MSAGLESVVELLKETETLRKIPLFAKLEPSKLKLLAFTSQLLSYDDGEVLFHEGDLADCAFVVMDGEVEILAQTASGDVVVGTLGKDELFGEIALLNNAPRSATLRARGRLQALRITDEMFLSLVTENPGVALEVMRQLSDKLARTHKQVEALQGELSRSGS